MIKGAVRFLKKKDFIGRQRGKLPKHLALASVRLYEYIRNKGRCPISRL